METEFAFTPEKVFTYQDLVKIKGQDWKSLDEATDQEIKTIHRLLMNDCEIAAYIRYQVSRGVNELRELVRLCARKFFPKFTAEPDIDENGNIHKETH